LSVPDESFRYFKQDKCELIVPQGTVDLYKSAPVWKNFGSITDTLFTIKVEFIFAITSRLKGEWTKVITERGTLLAATEKGRKWTCDATKNILLYNSMAPIYFYNGCFTFRLNSDLTTCTLVGHNNNAYPHVVDIPSTATYEGRIYTVTGIEDYPFWFRDPPEPFPLQPYHEDSRSSLIPDPDEEYWIENLFEITIPNTVKCIGHPLCTDCYELTEIHVALDNPCFSSKDGVLFNKDQSRLIAYPPGIRGRFDIPSSVTSIRDGAFYLSHVTSVTIHSLVTSIGEGAFEMSYLRRIDVDPDNPQYCDEDGVLFSKDKTKLIAYTDARKNYRIPDSVKSIGEKAFVGCYFQTLTVPWEIPISIPSSVFKYHGLATKELIVPPGSEALYESAPVWQDFGFIISSDEYLSSDIKVNLDVHRDSSTLHINTPYVEEIEVSSISGAIIYKGVKSGWTMAIEVNYSENAIIVKGNGWRRKARKRTYYT
jgi:hypothetical protein